MPAVAHATRSPNAARGRTAHVVALAAALPALAAYLATLNPTVPAGDSGELATAAWTFGVAHPPGYPLYVLAGWLWAHLLPFGEPAWRLNVLSAACAAAAAGVLALVVRRLTGSAAAALVAAWSLAFSAPLWKVAVVAEVFAPNALLAACGLAAFAGATAPRAAAGGRARATLAFLTTLALSLHHTLLLLAVPLVTVALVTSRARLTRRDGARLTLAALAGLAPLALPPLAARSQTALVWGDPTTLRGFLRLLARADYGTFRLDPVAAGMQADRSHGVLYLESLPAGLGVPALVLAALGVVVVWRRQRPLALAIAGFAALQALFFSRVGFPSDVPVLRGAVERFYVLPGVVLCALAGLGAAVCLRAVRTRAAAPALAALALAWPLATHARLASQAGNRFTEHLGLGMLASAPRGAVLFVTGDLQHNALEYLTRVRRVRPDVTVVDQELLTYDWYARRLHRDAPDLLPALGRAERIVLRDGRTLDGLAARRPDGRVDLLLEDGNTTVDSATIARVEPADAATMFARTRAGFRNSGLVPPSDDRYSGLPGTRNVLWLEHLRGRRPVAFAGTKEDSWGLRWELVPSGLVTLPVPIGSAPAPVAQAARALELLPAIALDDYFRPWDPTGFEATERARLAACATRVALLLCQPGTERLGAPGDVPARVTGRARLRAFADRFERLDPTPDAACLRAIGFLRAFAADARDVARARADLERALAAGLADSDADEARRLLAQLAADGR